MTLDADNLTWLRGRALAGKHRSLSEALDDVVTAARVEGRPDEVRSVVGTIDISALDPDLLNADADIAAVYSQSLGRPFIARERPSTPSGGKTRKGLPRG